MKFRKLVITQIQEVSSCNSVSSAATGIKINCFVFQVKEKCTSDPAYEEVNNAFERALVFMHKMPRIWMDYCSFLLTQRRITRTRRVLDRALRALPITQHDRIWPIYIQFVKVRLG